jgi:hypothetical protein
MSPDILHYLIEGAISALVVFLAFKRAPGERVKDNSSALKDYIETARMAGEEIRQEREQRQDLERRLAAIEKKKYKIYIELEVGEIPTIGIVKIEPIIVDETKPLPRRGRKDRNESVII